MYFFYFKIWLRRKLQTINSLSTWGFLLNDVKSIFKWKLSKAFKLCFKQILKDEKFLKHESFWTWHLYRMNPKKAQNRKRTQV